jgi:hypothetical protein
VQLYTTAAIVSSCTNFIENSSIMGSILDNKQGQDTILKGDHQSSIWTPNLVSFHPVVLKIFKFFNKSEAMAAAILDAW